MQANTTSKPRDHGSLYGLLTFGAAVAAAGSAAMIGFTSFTAFNPPGWQSPG